MSLAIFFSFYRKASGADLAHTSQICPCLELSISRQPHFVLCDFFKENKKRVQEAGLEPAQSCDHRHLKPARLPIPPFLHITYEAKRFLK